MGQNSKGCNIQTTKLAPLAPTNQPIQLQDAQMILQMWRFGPSQV